MGRAANVTVFLDDGDVRLYLGDALETLRAMPDESVDCVVTSPPYWGLRDYGTGAWAGGDPDCDHEPDPDWIHRRYLQSSGLAGNGPSKTQADAARVQWRKEYGDECPKCGATRQDQQMGLEATPDLFVQNMVELFREVRRVLAAHGTCWVNLGDSYGTGSLGRNDADRNFTGGGGNKLGSGNPGQQGAVDIATGLKPKDLVGIPWRVAFALQQDGWVLRSDVIWAKPNPMPESVTDRPTKSHEYLFLLTKARWVGAIEPTPMADRDAAWLAALIDGEGSICFQERANKEWASTVSPRMSIVNTNRALLERAAELTGIATNGTSAAPRIRNDRGEHRPVWTWQITDKKAARILTAIRPYLIAKRTQADLALAVYALNAKRKGRGKEGRTSDADLAYKRRCAAACSDLNHGRDVDLSWFTPPADGRWVPEKYAFDAEAVREPLGAVSLSQVALAARSGVRDDRRPKPLPQNGGSSVLEQAGGGARGSAMNPAGRNVRSVWQIATQPYPEAHFATFPEELARRCILAGCPVRVCRVCGKPSERIVERTVENKVIAGRGLNGDRNDGGVACNADRTYETVGWSDCGHNQWRLGIVLDPFIGSGTVAKVARDHQRHAIGIDLNAGYLDLAARRLQQLSLLST